MMFMATCNLANMVRAGSCLSMVHEASWLTRAPDLQIATIVGKAKQRPAAHAAAASPKNGDAAPRLAPVKQNSDPAALDTESTAAAP